jgi:hypothetical protein
MKTFFTLTLTLSFAPIPIVVFWALRDALYPALAILSGLGGMPGPVSRPCRSPAPKLRRRWCRDCCRGQRQDQRLKQPAMWC